MLGGLQAARELQGQGGSQEKQRYSCGLPLVLGKQQAAADLPCRCEPEVEAQL